MESKPTKFYSSKQENMIADFLGWKVVSGSGAAPCVPGDIIGDDWLGECKTHTSQNKPIFFSETVWKKIVDESSMRHRYAALFADDGSQKESRTWCLCDLRSLNSAYVTPLLVPFEPAIRRNISFDGLKQLDAARAVAKERNVTTSEVIFKAHWSGVDVAIMQLSAFKEAIDQ